jgi:hypothetical protein
MAFKACRSLTFILLLSLSVVSLTATVGISPVVASCGSGGSTSGDPDSPKDTGPRPTYTQSKDSQVGTTVDSLGLPPNPTPAQVVQWLMVQQLLSSMLGRGLLR